jgi:outer membrane biosynthesis protein TonB
MVAATDFKRGKNNFTPHFISFLYILGVLCILFFWKLTKPIELDESGGLLVDFGYTEQGLGDEEPDQNNPMNQLSIPAPGNPPFTQEVTEKVLVQDEEMTEAVNAPEKVEKQKIVVVENMLKNPVKSEKINPKSTLPTKNPTEQKKVNDNALFTGFKGTGSGNGSQGNTNGQGNMGDPNGGKADNYLGKSTGLGSEADGRGMIGKGLFGRKLSSIPSITDNSNKTGKIVIKVVVAGDGKVTSASFTPQGSTLTDSDLIQKCESAAKRAKFTANQERETDQGTLIFAFDVR